MSEERLKVLVVGGGGREHALAWKIAASPRVEEVLCAPGNAGTARVGRNVPLSVDDHDGLVRLARDEGCGLVVIGPEEPLCRGLADRLRAQGVCTFGPGAGGARIEGSKLFAKELLERHHIPTAPWRRFDRAGAAKSYLETLSIWPQVIKADGLAAGKGVHVCRDVREACSIVDALMEERILGDAGLEVVIEEFLVGQEVSVQAITDGRTLLILEAVVDHKQVGEGDTGPNTGGMGIVSPVPFAGGRVMRQIEQRILIPALHALRVEEIEYRGVLYVGLMVTEAGPQVLEFNCRFGDPEIQALVRRLRCDLVPYLVLAADGSLGEADPPEWDERSCVGVVAASEGYPGPYAKGDPIFGLEDAGGVEEAVVFHGGTRREGDEVVTNGGRVLAVTALGGSVEEARERAYDAYDRIRWDGKFCRRDIGLPRPRDPGTAAGAPESDRALGVGGGADGATENA